MNNIAQQTLGEIVTANFKAAQVFEKYGLDFCCKGKKPLEQACAEKDLDINEVTYDLNNLSAHPSGVNARFADWELDFLADYIVNNHHAYVRAANERLRFYTAKVARVHGERNPELLRIAELFDALALDMEAHMPKEEIVLFPYIKELVKCKQNHAEPPLAGFGTVLVPIQRMEAEHEEAGLLIEEIRKLSNDFTPPASACNTYRVTYAELKEYEKDLHQHIHLENNLLFPKAIALEEELIIPAGASCSCSI